MKIGIPKKSSNEKKKLKRVHIAISFIARSPVTQLRKRWWKFKIWNTLLNDFHYSVKL